MKMKSCILSLILSSCFLFPEENAGVVVTGNTIAVDGQKIKVGYEKGSADTAHFFAMVQSAARILPPPTMQESGVYDSTAVQFGWGFENLSSGSFAPSIGGAPAASVQGPLKWTEWARGAVFLDSMNQLLVPNPLVGADTLSVSMQMFAQDWKSKKLLSANSSDGFQIQTTPEGKLVLKTNSADGALNEIQGSQSLLSQQWYDLELRKSHQHLEVWLNGKKELELPVGLSWKISSKTLAIGKNGLGGFEGLLDYVLIKSRLDSNSNLPSMDTLQVELSTQQVVHDCEISFPQSQTLANKASQNQNSLNWLSVGAYDASTVGRALISFDVPDSLKNLELLHAELKLELYEWFPKSVNDSARINVHGLLKSWDENTVTAGSSTWSKVGLQEGVDYGPVLATMQKAFGDSQAWTIDLSKTVSEWLAYPSSNYGVLLRNQNEMQNVFYGYPKFWSKTGDPLKAPKLMITVLRPHQ